MLWLLLVAAAVVAPIASQDNNLVEDVAVFFTPEHHGSPTCWPALVLCCIITADATSVTGGAVVRACDTHALVGGSVGAWVPWVTTDFCDTGRKTKIARPTVGRK